MTGPIHLTGAKIRDIAFKRGASACGIVRAETISEHARFYAAAAGVPAGLAYLRRSPLVRSDIRNWFPPAKSVLVCAFQYWHSGLNYAAALKKNGGPSACLKKIARDPRPEFTPGMDPDGPCVNISRYALVPDYHEVIREKLGLILADIKAACPGTEGKPFTDTSPVLEKELGRQAGLGFRGKNTLLISKELGSYFFIGGLALSLDSGPGESPVPDREQGCGACGKCAAACPTGALNVSGALDAGLCISYWTTQSKTAVPEEIMRKSGGYIYGCDICQDVCPYNSKTSDRISLPEFRNNI